MNAAEVERFQSISDALRVLVEAIDAWDDAEGSDEMEACGREWRIAVDAARNVLGGNPYALARANAEAAHQHAADSGYDRDLAEHEITVERIESGEYGRQPEPSGLDQLLATSASAIAFREVAPVKYGPLPERMSPWRHDGLPVQA